MNRGPFGRATAAWRFVVDVSLRWYHGRVGDLAASVTFWILVSLPAFVLALLAVLGPLNRVVSALFSAQLDESQLREEVQDFVHRVFTDESGVISRTVDSLFDQSNSGLFLVSVGFALWSISRGFAGLIRALEDIYQIEDRRTWYHTRFVAVLIGLGSMLMPIGFAVLDQVLWSRVPDSGLERFIRTGTGLAVMVLWASVVYHWGPAKRSRWRYELPGAIVAAAGWWLLTFGFTWYVRRASGVTSAVGTGILALTWVWMAAQILLAGAAVNLEVGIRLGISRGRRTWTLPEVVRSGTGEIRKIVAADGERDGDGGRRSEKSLKSRLTHHFETDDHPAVADDRPAVTGQGPRMPGVPAKTAEMPQMPRMPDESSRSGGVIDARDVVDPFDEGIEPPSRLRSISGNRANNPGTESIGRSRVERTRGSAGPSGAGSISFPG